MANILGHPDLSTMVASYLTQPELGQLASTSNDLYNHVQNVWKERARSLSEHPATFCGKIFAKLKQHRQHYLDQGLHVPSLEQLVDQTDKKARTIVKHDSNFLHPGDPIPPMHRYAFHAIDERAITNRREIETTMIDKIKGLAAPNILAIHDHAIDYLMDIIAFPLLFDAIPVKDLGQAFRLAANGHLDCLNAIIASNRFGEIPVEDLGQAVRRAAQNEHLDCLNAIIASNRFGEIHEAKLGWAFSLAAYDGHLDCLNAIIASNRFGDIHVVHLGGAFKNAAQNEQLDCLNAIIASNRFGEWTCS